MAADELVRVRVKTCEMTSYEGTLEMSRAKFELLQRGVLAGDEDTANEVHDALILGTATILEAVEPDEARVLSFELESVYAESQSPTGQQEA